MVKLNKLNNFNFIKFFVVIFCSYFSLYNFSNYNINLIYANNINNNNLTAKSAILIEASTGQVIYELNPDEALSPASITKLMTIFLIYEAVSNNSISWEDVVTVSEYASSMGGSQIFLEAGETQTVKDLTRSIVIASANDAAVAMAEFIGGSESEFVNLMNQKAISLNMTSSNFENACGLDEETSEHYMSARDIAIISHELIRNYPEVYEFTQTWQDSITHTTSNGTTEFGLTNTNKLLKLYDYATGLKTGSTEKALYCLSGTAKKDGIELIAVVMGASTPNARFEEVIQLFEYGFSNYEVTQCAKQGEVISKASVYKGEIDFVEAVIEEDLFALINKSQDINISQEVQIIDGVTAPIEAGTKLGEVIYTQNSQEVGRVNLIAKNTVEKANLIDVLKRLIIEWVI